MPAPRPYYMSESDYIVGENAFTAAWKAWNEVVGGIYQAPSQFFELVDDDLKYIARLVLYGRRPQDFSLGIQRL